MVQSEDVKAKLHSVLFTRLQRFTVPLVLLSVVGGCNPEDERVCLLEPRRYHSVGERGRERERWRGRARESVFEYQTLCVQVHKIHGYTI